MEVKHWMSAPCPICGQQPPQDPGDNVGVDVPAGVPGVKPGNYAGVCTPCAIKYAPEERQASLKSTLADIEKRRKPAPASA